MTLPRAAVTRWASLTDTGTKGTRSGQREETGWLVFFETLKTPLRVPGPTLVPDDSRPGKFKSAPGKNSLPGWSPATFVGGVRSKATCERVYALGLDFDKGTTLDVAAGLFAFFGFLHTTWQHTESFPRCRVILPYARSVTPEEHARIYTWAIARAAAGGVVLDTTPRDPSRLWFVPGIAEDGIFEARDLTGPVLDPDETLRALEASTQPTLPVQPRVRLVSVPTGSDVLTRASKYLQRMPAAVAGEHGHTSLLKAAMVLVWRFDLSKSDALDLLRADFNPRCTPPWSEDDLARKVDEADKADGASRRGPRGDLRDAPLPKRQAPHDPETGEVTTGGAEAWRSGLSVDRHGRTKNTFGNLCKILRDAPEYRGKLRLNAMSQAVELDGVPLPESYVGVVREAIEDNAAWGGFAPGEIPLLQAIRAVAEERRYHPVQDYLRALVWDGVSRLGRVATEILGATTALETDQCARWFVGTVRRALTPGTKMDTALVLVGPQGAFKSTFFAVLGGVWFADTEITLGDKDTYGQIHWAWIYELGEIDHVTSARHAGQIKQFLSRKSDLFRPPYGRFTENHPRSVVIVGSTNEPEFLNDPTGSRRFHLVRCGRIDLDLLRAWRDQLWAEAVHHANDPSVRHWFDAIEDAAREVAAEPYRIRDPWEDTLALWIHDRWPSIRTETRKAHLTSADLLARALDLKPRDTNKAVEMRLGRCMRTLGYQVLRQRLRADEQGLYREPDGSALSRIRAWVTTEEAAVYAAEGVGDAPS